MARCEYCRDEGARFRCNWCDQVHCGPHRLPEKHDCDGSQYEYQKKKENTVEPIDPNSVGRTGKRPTGDFGESSPDISPDGSIVRDGNNSDSQTNGDDKNSSLINKLLFWR